MSFIDDNYEILGEDLQADICLEDLDIDNPTWNNDFEYDKDFVSLFTKDLVNRSTYKYIFTPNETNAFLLAVNNIKLKVSDYKIYQSTAKAINVKIFGKSVWFPKSKIDILENELNVPIWLLIQNNLIHNFECKGIYSIKLPYKDKFVKLYIKTTFEDLRIFNYSIKSLEPIWTDQTRLKDNLVELKLRYKNEIKEYNNGYFYK